jgi:aspartate aminotransferase
VTSIALAGRILRIKPSPSSVAADRASALKRSGRSIVSLVVGEPDFDTPPHIRAAAAQAMEQGATRYTQLAGTPELRAAIADKLRRENGLTYAPQDIIVTNGCKSAIYAAFAATLDVGDEVIVPAPYWVSYTDVVLCCDGVPVTIPCGEDQGFKLTAEQLEAAITPRTRWLILNSPSNPTGATYTLEEYAALAKVLERHPNVLVMTDDIYEHIRFEGGTAPHFLNAAPKMQDRTLAINGVSKTYAMTGFRIGWAAGPAVLIKALDTLLSQAAGNACSVSQAAALAALTGDQTFLAESLAVYRERRDVMARGINDIPGLSCLVPEGAFYLYINCAGLIGKTTPDGTVLADDGMITLYLLESVGVAVVAGAAYGLSPYVRISTATSIETLQDGLTRIADAVSRLR